MRTLRALAAAVLVLLTVAGCGSSDDDGADDGVRSTTTASGPVTTTSAVPTAEDRLASLQFRPVVSSGPCPSDGGGGAPTPTTAASASAAEPVTVPDRDGSLCYDLGPAGGDGNDINKGVVAWADGPWRLRLFPKALSIPDLEAMFARCYDGTPECPAGEGGRGSVAVVWDGVLVSAVPVQEPGMGSRVFTLRVALTDSQAEELSVLVPAT